MMFDKIYQFSSPLSGKHWWWNLALFIMAIGLPLSWSRYGKMLREARVGRTISFVASVVIGVNVVAAFVYFILPWYFDHVETQVVITALNAHQGLPLYPDWSRGEGAYGLGYGPFLYAAVGAPLFFSKSVIASKFVTSTAFFFAMTAMWSQGRRSLAPSADLIAKFFLLAVIPFKLYAFWVRGDPLLLALAAASVMVIQIRSDILRWLALGVFAGLATAIKLHAALYFVPLAAFALVRVPCAKAIISCAALGVIAFVSALIIAFAADPHQAVSFGKYIAVMTRIGISRDRILVNVLVALALTAPYGIALLQERLHDWRTILTAGTMALSVALVILIGATPGAGPHHLMPLLPALLFFTLTARGSKVAANNPSPILAVAMIATAVGALSVTIGFLKSSAMGAGDITAGYREAADMAVLYPGAQFGPTDRLRYGMLQYRVGAALRGAKLTFDMAAWLDLAAAGVHPSDDPADFSPGPLIWILPREGAPFSLNSPYTGASIFPAAFQADFQSRYQQIDVRKFFAVWRCKSGTP
jgi:hypothetical protein